MQTPLQKICQSYVYEAAPNVEEEAANVAVEILSNILKGTIDIETAKTSIEALIGSTTPAEKVYCIAKVDINKPIIETPSLPEKPEHGRRRARPWTTEEDYRLLAAIYKHGLDNWGQVVKIVGNGRTRPQCSQRWYRGIDPKINKSQWTEEEDHKLLKLAEELGTKVWSKIAHHMGTRSDVQCRYRYFQISKAKTQSRRNSSSIQKSASRMQQKTKLRVQVAPIIEQKPQIQYIPQFQQPVEDLTKEVKQPAREQQPSQPLFDFAETFDSFNFNSNFDMSSIDMEFSFL